LQQRWFSSLQARFDFPLLLLWTVIGGVFRFTQLTAKPPWTDEFATLVFSLGNDFKSVPLNQIISINTLLQPLQVNPDATIATVVSLLIYEDNHPPLYFVLAHLWMKLFPSTGEYVDLSVARSLPALFGVISIPAIYFLGKVAFNSRLVGLLSAAMMAVSPYAIFLAQEARHYTLAILLVIASLGCFIVVIKYLSHQILLPISLIFLWVIINTLGLSVHYFFSLTLFAEAIVLIFLPFSSSFRPFFFRNGWRLGIVLVGTIAAVLIWILILPRDYGNGMTDWIQSENNTILGLVNPVFQLIATWITMISLLPVESSSLPVVIFSGIVMIVFFLWLFPLLKWGAIAICKQSNFSLATKSLIGFIIGVLFLFFCLTYFGKVDLTRGARYSFTYFPAVITILGAILAVFWRRKEEKKKLLNNHSYFFKDRGKTIVAIAWLMGFLSAITVCVNLGYQKYYRPDLLVPIILQNSSVPILITTPHTSLVQTGEMMGLAWEFKRYVASSKVLFFLAHQEHENFQELSLMLQEKISKFSQPIDVWTINFSAPLEVKGCQKDSKIFPLVNGYQYNLYHCL
jgi:uncharacterized membrane protein